MLTNTLKSQVRKLWDKFWSGGITNPITAIDQITYLLFMKRIDVLDTREANDADDEQFHSRFDGKFVVGKDAQGNDICVDKQTLRWASFKELNATELFDKMQQQIFPFIKQLNGNNSFFTKHMANAVFLIPKPSLLQEAVSIIEEIFKEIDNTLGTGKQSFQDTQGDIYEYLLSEIATSGKNGQFRTPRHIIKLVCRLVKPQLGQRIADPACGSGGFLLGAYQYILTQNTNKESCTIDEDGFEYGSRGDKLIEQTDRDTLHTDTLFGFDIDTNMVRIGLMNLMMHGIGKPYIDYGDALSKNFNKPISKNKSYDVVLANPPFTGNLDKADIDPELKQATTKTELLFLERIFQILRIGGTAGVIIPQGVLFGSGKAFVSIRTMLVEQCELKAVIAMPSGVFRPYAGVATAILIFTRGDTTQKTWFYNMESDGYTLDDKRSKTNASDLQDIVKWFEERNSATYINNRKQKHFFVNKDELIANNYDLSFNKYKEEDYEVVDYGKPSDILDELDTLESSIQEKLTNLRNLLKF